MAEQHQAPVTLRFTVKVPDTSGLSFDQYRSVEDLLTGVGEAKQQRDHGFDVVIEADDLWEAAMTYYGLRDEVDAVAGTSIFTFPERPDIEEA